jgi:hypothetical protein
MKPTVGPPGVAVYLRRLPVTVIVAIILWYILRPAIDVAVSGAAQFLIRSYEHPKVTRLVADSHLVKVQRADFRSDSVVPTVALTEIHVNTIVLLALFLALNRPLSRPQLERLLMGWSLLFLSQALNLVFHVKYLYATGLGAWSLSEYTAVGRNVYGFLQYFTDLPGRFSFPFLIWFGFNWQQITAMLGKASGTPTGNGDPDARKRRKSEGGSRKPDSL